MSKTASTAKAIVQRESKYFDARRAAQKIRQNKNAQSFFVIVLKTALIFLRINVMFLSDSNLAYYPASPFDPNQTLVRQHPLIKI
jgi:hypothetical protein